MTESTTPDSPSDPAAIFDAIDDALKIVSAELVIAAPSATVFDLIADPARQPEWDGNGNLGEADAGQRITEAGTSFITTLTKGVDRENHVVDFEEGGRIAWMPSEVGGEPFGQAWIWEIEPRGEGAVLVRHTYDWTRLRDPQRLPRAQSMTRENLLASLERLKALAES